MYPDRPAIYNSGQACEGLNLVVSITGDKENSIVVMDLNGKVIHRWIVDWFKIWPDAKHVPKASLPKSLPGTSVHGIVLMDNGDLIFNFERLGLVRMDIRGRVIWRLPYRTHHSVFKDDDGNLWVCGFKEHLVPDARFPGFSPPFHEDTILVVSPEGVIIQEWSVPEILRKNDLAGLLYMPSAVASNTSLDRLHLNDVEPFPANLKEGFFKKGDVLVSLRNINTVFVFNRESQKIGFIMTGKFVKQHDPNFIDGNSFSLFDNNRISSKLEDFQSRILIVSAPENTVRVFFEGSSKTPFRSETSGKHMWLPNGNLLITETDQGRAFEINPRGEVVWEYINYIGGGKAGGVAEVRRLSPEYIRLFKH
ncbi:MAG: arylsulfotransferase family protein [Candidatus Omnitrophica bacterium]|nr:arylsulfotransferase family protein [Candidatus Omnitrophota bacterium]